MTEGREVAESWPSALGRTIAKSGRSDWYAPRQLPAQVGRLTPQPAVPITDIPRNTAGCWFAPKPDVQS